MQPRQIIRQAGHLALASLAAYWLAGSARAQAFPSKPITIVVAFAPGGPADTMSRAVAQELSPLLGQPVVVDNKAGAGGKIAMQAVLRAPRDGHTLAYISSSILSVAPLLDKEIGYDPLKDIQPLTTGLSSSNAIVVHPSIPARNLRELVTWARANPDKLNYGSIGIGSWYHLATEKLLSGLGIEATHVPYRGEAPALVELAAGQIQLMIVSGAGKALLDDGRLVAIASTGSRPAVHAPRAQPARESGIPALADYDEVPWVGFGLAAGAPPDVVTRLHQALVRALQSNEVRTRLAAFGDTVTSTPAELQRIIQRELQTNRQLILSGRVKLN
ncbi:MAG: tripartite tricarboxylate transporter substrate binding protein [Betaproteobacteria bacterium]|nr:tripartite tricarboxylate transporter substrate binding protein [Betaproteobacteria bacterium]MBM3383502.1 tripartite tricarboxylate transporter substrate binding protein [Betaproteobacteria bacterium]